MVGTRVVALSGAMALSGCAVTPQVPLGAPLAPREVALRAGWGTSYGRSTARVVDRAGTVHTLVGNGDSALGAGPVHPGLLQLQFAGARAAVSPRWDVGAYGGWYGAGGGARYRLTAPESVFALHLGADGQVGYLKPTALRVPYAGRLLAEGAGKVGRRLLVLGNLGASLGRRRHGIDLTSVMDSPPLDGFPFIPVEAMMVERQEIRLEGAVGAALDASRVVVELLLMPYAVLRQGSARGVCQGSGFCETLLDYRQGWGFSVLIDLSARVRGDDVAGGAR